MGGSVAATPPLRPCKGAGTRGVPPAPLAAEHGATGNTRSGAEPGLPPAQRARDAADAWREIGASRWVRRALQFGLRLPWLTPRGRPRRRFRPYTTTSKDHAFVSEELDRWVAAGFIRPLDDEEQSGAPRVSPAFVSWIRQDNPRLVVDLRQVNEHLQDIKFKYVAITEFMSALVPHDNLISWDIKDAYHHVYVHPSDRPYLTFAVDGRVFEPLTMPFGLSVAPWAWTKIMRPVLAYLRQSGFTLIGYVDDHGAAPPGARPTTKADAAKGFRFVTHLFHRLGLTLHPAKGEREGTQQLTLLGFTIDTAGNQVGIPDGRLARLRVTAAAVLSSASANRRWVGRKPLESVAGIIVSASLAIPEARLFARAIYDDLARAAAARGPHADCRLSHQSLRDLRWWAHFGRAGHGRPLWARAPAHTLHTDASGFGWGGVADETTPVRGAFSGSDRDWHINIKEVAAIRLCLTALAPKFAAGDVVRVVTDSRFALHVVNALVYRSAPLCSEVRRLYQVAQRLGVTLDAAWIPTAYNVWADRLSRTRESTTWSLDPTFFASLDSLCGPHVVGRLPDLLAAPPSSDVPASGSTPPAPTVPDWRWTRVNNWVNPACSSLPLVLDLLRRQWVTATVIAPVWRAQPWWQQALLQANEFCFLPRRAGLPFRAAGAVQVSRPHWRVCALRFIRGGRDALPPPGQARQRQSASTPSATALVRPLPRRCSPTSWRPPPGTPTRPSGRLSSTFAKQVATPRCQPPPRRSHATSASCTSAERPPRAPCRTISPP